MNEIELAKRSLEVAGMILKNVSSDNPQARTWAENVGGRIANRELKLKEANDEGNEILAKYNREALDRLARGGAELAAFADVVKDKTLLEMLEKAALEVIGFLIDAILKGGG